MANHKDNIIAIATPQGNGAISIIRLSGPDVIALSSRFFKPHKGKPLSDTPSHRLRFGELVHNDEIIDEVLISVFRAPNSYTGENQVEISCHASPYIQERILQMFMEQGVRPANPGEFTMRAFLNGKMDLTRAEAVADLIAAESRLQHRAALHQLRGGFVQDIKALRDRLVEFTSLLELELDFAEEDVEFADRKALNIALTDIRRKIQALVDSFAEGNVIKNGVAVSIVGAPNTGKSTLLNALINEEKAIVTDIPGTTRDAIEDKIRINGILFRFIDTAGIRQTDDHVERLGIERTFGKIGEAGLVLWLIDALHFDDQEKDLQKHLNHIQSKHPGKPVIILLNKIDLIDTEKADQMRERLRSLNDGDVLAISAKHKKGLEQLRQTLTERFRTHRLDNDQTVVTNVRHYHALKQALKALDEVEEGFRNGLSTDLIAIDLRDVLHHLGEITGEISSDDLLSHIFQNFCIGK